MSAGGWRAGIARIRMSGRPFVRIPGALVLCSITLARSLVERYARTSSVTDSLGCAIQCMAWQAARVDRVASIATMASARGRHAEQQLGARGNFQLIETSEGMASQPASHRRQPLFLSSATTTTSFCPYVNKRREQEELSKASKVERKCGGGLARSLAPPSSYSRTEHPAMRRSESIRLSLRGAACTVASKAFERSVPSKSHSSSQQQVR